MKKIYDCMVPNGTYKKDGQEKTSWLRIGAILQKDDGKAVMKLDCVPVSNDFEGWVQLFAPQESQQSAPAPKNDDFDSDVPF